MTRNDDRKAPVVARVGGLVALVVLVLLALSPQPAAARALNAGELLAEAASAPTAPGGAARPTPESSGQAAKQSAAKPARRRSPVAAVESRISLLHQRLHITAAQEPQFKAYAEVMRQNAQTIEGLFAERAKSTEKSAVARLRWYAQLSAAHAEAVGKLIVPFEALYQGLSADQKKAADALFEQIRQRPPPHRVE